MEYDELEQAVRRLNEVMNEFPIGATTPDDFIPIEKKVRMAREMLMCLNARLLMLKAKYKRHMMDDDEARKDRGEIAHSLQRVTSDVLINSKAVKLCLHSTTILSILDNKEGNAEDRKKLYAFMSKLFYLNDSIISVQQSIEEESQVQLDLKAECQKALFDYRNFLKKQEEVRSKKLQEKHPDIVRNKTKMENTLRKINIMKKLIRNFIAASGDMLTKEPTLLEMLKNHRELINIETIVKMSQDSNVVDNV